MLNKTILITSILTTALAANDCSSYYNPNKFYDAPEYLAEYIDENLKGLELFGNKENYSKLNFNKHNNNYTNEFIKLNDYIYPKKSGLFSYKVKDTKVDELSISTVNLYKYTDTEIANEINDDFEGFWSDWNEDGYEMQLVPEQVLFTYKEKYFSFSVFIYGVKGDTSRLKGTSIKYWFKDYTKEVNEYITCNNKK